MPVAAYSHHAGLSVQKTPYSAGSPCRFVLTDIEAVAVAMLLEPIRNE